MGADPAPAHPRTGAVKGALAALIQDWIVLTLASTEVLTVQVRPKAQDRNGVSQTSSIALWLDTAV